MPAADADGVPPVLRGDELVKHAELEEFKNEVIHVYGSLARFVHSRLIPHFPVPVTAARQKALRVNGKQARGQSVSSPRPQPQPQPQPQPRGTEASPAVRARSVPPRLRTQRRAPGASTRLSPAASPPPLPLPRPSSARRPPSEDPEAVTPEPTGAGVGGPVFAAAPTSRRRQPPPQLQPQQRHDDPQPNSSHHSHHSRQQPQQHRSPQSDSLHDDELAIAAYTRQQQVRTTPPPPEVAPAASASGADGAGGGARRQLSSRKVFRLVEQTEQEYRATIAAVQHRGRSALVDTARRACADVTALQRAHVEELEAAARCAQHAGWAASRRVFFADLHLHLAPSVSVPQLPPPPPLPVVSAPRALQVAEGVPACADARPTVSAASVQKLICKVESQFRRKIAAVQKSDRDALADAEWAQRARAEEAALERDSVSAEEVAARRAQSARWAASRSALFALDGDDLDTSDKAAAAAPAEGHSALREIAALQERLRHEREAHRAAEERAVAAEAQVQAASAAAARAAGDAASQADAAAALRDAERRAARADEAAAAAAGRATEAERLAEAAAEVALRAEEAEGRAEERASDSRHEAADAREAAAAGAAAAALRAVEAAQLAARADVAEEAACALVVLKDEQAGERGRLASLVGAAEAALGRLEHEAVCGGYEVLCGAVSDRLEAKAEEAAAARALHVRLVAHQRPSGPLPTETAQSDEAAARAVVVGSEAEAAVGLLGAVLRGRAWLREVEGLACLEAAARRGLEADARAARADESWAAAQRLRRLEAASAHAALLADAEARLEAQQAALLAERGQAEELRAQDARERAFLQRSAELLEAVWEAYAELLFAAVQFSLSAKSDELRQRAALAAAAAAADAAAAQERQLRSGDAQRGRAAVEAEEAVARAEAAGAEAAAAAVLLADQRTQAAGVSEAAAEAAAAQALSERAAQEEVKAAAEKKAAEDEAAEAARKAAEAAAAAEKKAAADAKAAAETAERRAAEEEAEAAEAAAREAAAAAEAAKAAADARQALLKRCEDGGRQEVRPPPPPPQNREHI